MASEDNTKVIPRLDELYEPKFLDLWEGLSMTAGVATLLYNNYRKKIPISVNGYWAVPLYLLGGYAFGHMVASGKNWYLKRKVENANRYIALHPQDFIDPPPKKFKDVLYTWHPVR